MQFTIVVTVMHLEAQCINMSQALVVYEEIHQCKEAISTTDINPGLSRDEFILT